MKSSSSASPRDGTIEPRFANGQGSVAGCIAVAFAALIGVGGCVASAAATPTAPSAWTTVNAPNGCQIAMRPLIDGNGRSVGMVAVTATSYCSVSVALR